MDFGDGNKTFPLGAVVATPAALRLLRDNGLTPMQLLLRHSTGDWSEMDKQDQEANSLAIKSGARLFASYDVTEQDRVWIITEADRSSTTILLPSDY